MDLNEYQKKRIEERLKLDFKKEKDNISESRQRFSKNFRNELDILIQKLYNNGVMFYGFTILMPFLEKDNPELWYLTHLGVEKWIERLKEEVELIEFCYISIELHEKETEKEKKIKFSEYTKDLVEYKSLEGLPHLHGVIGVRSLIGDNEMHLNEIRKVFNIPAFDIDIKKLKNFYNIKRYWNYCIYENNFKFHRFTQYSNHFPEIYGSIADLELSYDESHYAFGLDETYGAKYSEISGIMDVEPDGITIINYLITLYFLEKNYYINNNFIMKRIKNTKYSWEFVDNIDSLNFKNLEIFNELKKKYYQQLNELKISKLFNKSWDNFYESIKKKNHYLPTININERIVEFKDGLYFLEHNYFYDFNKNDKILNINCDRYFDKTYRTCKEKLPEFWLESLKKTLKKKNVDDFCINFAKYFHKMEKNKQKTMCIVGETDTSKTTLVTRILTELLGKENVGIISDESSFAFEDIENKKIIICEEFKYNTSNRSNLLKILDNQLILMDKKNEKKKTYLNEIPILFLFNSGINDKMLNDPSFLSRLLLYKFKKRVKNKDNSILQLLYNEIPNILLYCNNLLFEENSKKTPFSVISNNRRGVLKELKKSLFID